MLLRLKGTKNIVINTKKVQKRKKKRKMHKHELSLSVLPTDLQDLILMYTFNLPKKAITQSLDVMLDIAEMQLPFFFLRERIWSWHYEMFLPNPMFSFMPIEYYGGKYHDLFDEDSIFCFLIGLDFRRRNVRLFGSRERWLNRICNSWRAVAPLAAYYRHLLRTKNPILRKKGPLLAQYL